MCMRKRSASTCTTNNMRATQLWRSALKRARTLRLNNSSRSVADILSAGTLREAPTSSTRRFTQAVSAPRSWAEQESVLRLTLLWNAVLAVQGCTVTSVALAAAGAGEQAGSCSARFLLQAWVACDASLRDLVIETPSSFTTTTLWLFAA